MSDHKPETLSVHAGTAPDPTTKARITPIYQTASYVFDDVDHASRLFNLQEFGNIYTRIMNPTNGALEGKIAALEGGQAALAVASGHAAQFLAFHTIMEPGREIVAAKKLYGGSLNQLGQSFRKMAWTTHFVDADDPANVAAAINDKTRAVFIESLANPGGVVQDIAAIAKVAHDAGVPLIVDNTMATPMLCRPIEHGADIVVHSATKFLNGHGNAIGGLIVDAGTFDWAKGGKYPALSEPNASYHGLTFTDAFGPLAFILAARTLGLRDLGMTMNPQAAHYTLMGIETLSLRMAKHVSNAEKVAAWLEQDPRVDYVTYAGLPSSPYHDRVAKICPKGAGGLFTFAVKGGYDSCVKLVNALEIFSHVANLGDTRSLVIHSASTTHRQLTPEQQEAAGAGPSVVRISIGIEDPDDLIADLDQALSKATA